MIIKLNKKKIAVKFFYQIKESSKVLKTSLFWPIGSKRALFKNDFFEIELLGSKEELSVKVSSLSNIIINKIILNIGTTDKRYKTVKTLGSTANPFFYLESLKQNLTIWSHPIVNKTIWHINFSSLRQEFTFTSNDEIPLNKDDFFIYDSLFFSETPLLNKIKELQSQIPRKKKIESTFQIWQPQIDFLKNKSGLANFLKDLQTIKKRNINLNYILFDNLFLNKKQHIRLSSYLEKQLKDILDILKKEKINPALSIDPFLIPKDSDFLKDQPHGLIEKSNKPITIKKNRMSFFLLDLNTVEARDYLKQSICFLHDIWGFKLFYIKGLHLFKNLKDRLNIIQFLEDNFNMKVQFIFEDRVPQASLPNIIKTMDSHLYSYNSLLPYIIKGSFLETCNETIFFPIDKTVIKKRSIIQQSALKLSLFCSTPLLFQDSIFSENNEFLQQIIADHNKFKNGAIRLLNIPSDKEPARLYNSKGYLLIINLSNKKQETLIDFETIRNQLSLSPSGQIAQGDMVMTTPKLHIFLKPNDYGVFKL